MNQAQLKYARERASTIYKKRVSDLRTAHTVEAKTLTNDEKLKALKAGRFSVPRKASSTHLSWWHNDITFTDEVKGGLNSDTFDPAKAKIDTAYEKLIDELVLGDNEQALALLKAFEAAE